MILSKVSFLLVGGAVLVFSTCIATYTATMASATASCSVVTPPTEHEQEDESMRRFLQGNQLPMNGGKRY